MSLGKIILTAAVVSGALWTVGVLVGLFSRGRDDDSPSPGLPQSYSGASQERRLLQDPLQRYQSYSGPHIASSHQQSPPVSARSHQAPSRALVYDVSGQSLSRDFLPIYDHRGYEAARAEARRLLRLEEKYLTKKVRAERRRDAYHASYYEQLIDSQRQIIDRLNAGASSWIYQENNRPGKLPADSVDLHGLRVVEAIDYADMAVQDAEEQGKHRLRLIVGKGKHSEGGVSKLKPAIIQALKSHGWHVEVDTRNTGVLVVWLGDMQFDMV